MDEMCEERGGARVARRVAPRAFAPRRPERAVRAERDPLDPAPRRLAREQRALDVRQRLGRARGRALEDGLALGTELGALAAVPPEDW